MRLIDADMLKTKVNHNLDEQDSYLPVHFSELIDSTPTFELKKSSWIEDENRGLVCGNCKEPTIWKYRFCPYCGAYMVNDKEPNTPCALHSGKECVKDKSDRFIKIIKDIVRGNEE